jgi:segregation and condensation protein B
MDAASNLKNVVEAALLAAGRPLSVDAIQALFDEIEAPDRAAIRAVLQELAADYADRGIEVVEVASGWRIQVGKACSPWVSRLWEDRPPRYSRALLETLALIAYRQPITRGEIEDIRGVSVSTTIIKTLLEREWVRVVGQRDVPGRPSLYGTTREFLDYFGLKSLDELPTLAELRDLDEINRELDLGDPDGLVAAANPDIGEAGEAGDEPGPEPDREQPLAHTQDVHGAMAMEPDVADAERVAGADDAPGGPEMASPREHDAALADDDSHRASATIPVERT